jgi:Fe2+ transport system protein FeoA
MNDTGTQGAAEPLGKAPSGTPLRVAGMDGGQAFRMRLAAMGIRIGTELQVVQRQASGPLIVALRGTRIAIGRGMLDRILVTPAPPAGEATHVG